MNELTYSVNGMSLEELMHVNELLYNIRSGNVPVNGIGDTRVDDDDTDPSEMHARPGPVAGDHANNPYAPIQGAALDRFGIPWHPQAHSSNKKEREAGGWMMKKGAKDFYERYMSQFAQQPAAPGQQTNGFQQHQPTYDELYALYCELNQNGQGPLGTVAVKEMHDAANNPHANYELYRTSQDARTKAYGYLSQFKAALNGGGQQAQRQGW